MKFDCTFFEDEVREGFYVSGIMKRVWAAQLEILEEIDKVCRKHDITWYAYAGTLLGAVRHGGYIPWDDDLDIMMFRKDYDRFCELAGDELPQGYVIMSMHEEEVAYEFHTRITNSHEINFSKDFTEKYHQCPFIMGVDIFPIDNLPPSGEEEEKWKELAWLCMHATETITSENKDTEEAKGILSQLEDLCDVRFDDEKPLKQQLYEMTEKIFCLYNEFESEDAAIACYWVEYHKDKYSLSWFKEKTMLPFETTMLPAPILYDEALRSKYGDYMKIVKGGSDHDYPFIVKQEAVWKERTGLEYPFEYQFSKDDLYCGERLPARRSKTEAEQFMALMERAHGMIGTMLPGGNVGDCLKLLEACQSRAIYTGTLIEEDCGEGSVTVGILEEYCELLYEIHELISEESITENAAYVIVENMEEIFKKLAESIKQEVFNRREVVFMPFRACYWETMEPVWKEALEQGCDVSVVPIPYYEKDAIGKMTDIHYEGDRLPEYVPVTDYETYDFEGRHPDVIVIQNPYDECNYTISVPPAFYSRNLRLYTEQLVYIPYFVMDEIEDDDEKGLFNMRYFCTVPGVVCADKVVVQSEQMRKRYIEYLTAFAGEDTRRIWENKIFAKGGTVI